MDQPGGRGLEITDSYAKHGTWMVNFSEVSRAFGLSETELTKLRHLVRGQDLRVKRLAKLLRRAQRSDSSASSEMSDLVSVPQSRAVAPARSSPAYAEARYGYMFLTTSMRRLRKEEGFAKSMGLQPRTKKIDKQNRVYDAVEVDATRTQGSRLKARGWKTRSSVVGGRWRQRGKTLSAGLPTLGKRR